MISLPKRKEESKEKTPVVVAAPPPVKVMVSGGIKAVSPKKLKKVKEAVEVVHNRNTRSQQKGPIKMIQVEPKQNKQRKRLVK